MTIPKNTVKSIEAQFSDFALANILPFPSLGKIPFFPENTWKKMGKENLLDPDLFKGQNLEAYSCLAITRAGRALVYKGGNLGMALSWMIHHLVARYLLGDMDDGHKPQGQLSRAMANGATVSFAVSEPKTGALKYMAATATQSKTGYILNGEKTYITNGPIANAFVVIAVTGYDKDKKQFSAFLVPKDTKGLTVLPQMEIGFFEPSPHSGICLKDCWVRGNALLGRQDHAHGMVLGFRKLEDAAMTGPVTGAMAFLLDAVAGKMAKEEKLEDKDAKQLGGLAAMLETADLLSWHAALAVDDPASPGHGAILLHFRDLVGQYLLTLEALVEKMNLGLPDPFGVLIHDLRSSSSIGKNISLIQQEKLGRALLQKFKKS
ncbi:MAG: hypothetical protein GY860_01485 [Desulfobacteraceae bacterium]|nr:hypothetical protein [Desulfobacteraceae bacterium]